MTIPRRQKHGLSSLLKAERRRIDGRSALGQAISTYQATLIDSLGGREALSAQDLCLVETISRDWIILQQVDIYIMEHGMINKRKRALWPVAVQRVALSNSLTSKLLALGLKRRPKPTKTLAQLLAEPSKPLPDRTESTGAGSQG